MELKINTSITLSTGSTASAAIIKTMNDKFDLANSRFICDIQAYKSQSDKDNGRDHQYPLNGDNIKYIEYAIPSTDISDAIANNPGDMKAALDEAYTTIGSNHTDRLLQALATAIGVTVGDIEPTQPD